MTNMTILQKIIFANLRSIVGKISISRIENLIDKIDEEFKECEYFALDKSSAETTYYISGNNKDQDKSKSPEDWWQISFKFRYNNDNTEYCDVYIYGIKDRIIKIQESGFKQLKYYHDQYRKIWSSTLLFYKRADGKTGYINYGNDRGPDRIDYSKMPKLTTKWSKWNYYEDSSKRIEDLSNHDKSIYINLLINPHNKRMLQDLGVTRLLYKTKGRTDKWYNRIKKDIEKELDIDAINALAALAVLDKIYYSILNMTPLNNNIVDFFKDESSMITFILTRFNDKVNEKLVSYINDQYIINKIQSCEQSINPVDFFKDKRSMYIFLLIWVKGRAKNKMLGLSDDVIKSSEKIHSTAKYIASVIKSEEDENTALALACLCKTCRSIYSNLNIQNHS